MQAPSRCKLCRQKWPIALQSQQTAAPPPRNHIIAELKDTEIRGVNQKAKGKEKRTCPVSLRYNVRANITPDKEFKQDINELRKEAEQKLLKALTNFLAQRIKRNEKLLSEANKNTRAHRQDRSQPILNQAENKTLATACKSNLQENVRKLADNIQKQVAKVNAMMQELSEIKNVQNKDNE